MTMETAEAMRRHDDRSNGGQLVSADGRTLPLRAADLKADAKAGVARVVLEQRFVNPYDEPLTVTYQLPLPADAAVSGFSFTIGERHVVGEVDRRAKARERFEEAIASGHSAAIVEQERSSLFTQEIGNIPPKAEIVAEISIDQRLAWLDEGAWEWRFPTVVAPRYLGAEGRVPDADKVYVDVADCALPPRLGLSVRVRDAVVSDRQPESPSHPMRFAVGESGLEATFAEETGARLDRDVVVRWPVAAKEVGLSLDVARPAQGRAHAGAAYGLLTLVPPRPESKPEALPRDLILLIDTSGSMSGSPLDQARAVCTALVDSLGPSDRLEMIEFSSSPRRWKKQPVEATPANRNAARSWLAGLRASGGTEMREAIFEALDPLREGAQRQAVLVTDGQIGFETEVVRTVLEKLPAGSRLHTVGVGSAVNRSLTQAGARAGHGVEVILGIGERPDRAAQRLLARTHAPLVTELEIGGSAVLEHAPSRLPDLFAGAPALVSLSLRPAGGELFVQGRWSGGTWRQTLTVPAVACGEGSPAACSLFGRERVEDVEMRVAAGEGGKKADAEIEKLGLDFQISTRLTSWIAVSDQVDVDPTRASRREKMPQELPYGMSVQGLGLRAARSVCAAAPAPQMEAYDMAALPRCSAPMPRRLAKAASRPAPVASAEKKGGGLFEKARGLLFPKSESAPAKAESEMETARAPQFLGSAAAPARQLQGRIAIAKEGEVVIEIRVEGEELPWEIPALAQLVYEGALIEAKVDAGRTTKAGKVAAGQVIRIALRVDGRGKDKPSKLMLSAGFGCIEVALS
jgi:Ca-activated chloride channel family protein